MNWLNYFDLGLGEDEDTLAVPMAAVEAEPTLGTPRKDSTPKRASRKKRASKRFWLTLAMYFGLLLGILCEHWLGLIKANQPLTWASFGFERVLVADVVATAIFPHVFPKVFGRGEGSLRANLPVNQHILQFCVAFQNGFFWESLLKLLTLPS